MATTTLARTFTGANGQVNKWTYSFWVKRSGLGVIQVMTAPRYNGNFTGQIKFTSNDQIEVNDYRNSYLLQKVTNRRFRDTNGWYHIVVSNDNTVSSPDTKIYVNGVEETSFATDNEYSQNDTNSFNNDYPNYIGEKGTGDQFDGYMSHFHFIDGTAYTASTFGSTDATTGEWKINTSPSVTYGTNGFFILKDGNSVTDQSGNSNNWSVDSGTLTTTQDNPSNNFATWNKNLAMNSTMSLANGNTSGTTASNYSAGASNVWFSTLGMSSGKFYCEMKLSAASANQGEMVGVGYDLSKFQQGSTVSAYNIGYISEGWSYMGAEGKIKNNNSDVLTGMPTWGTNDIVCIAIDLDNYKLYFRKNGDAWINSGNPESGATGTGAVSLTSGKTYFFACSDASSANTYTYQANFGNGFFGTTAVSSAGTNASNNGIFEYDVPSGYTALSTKGLNL